MSFWDDVSFGLMTVCDNLRETKIGAKILDDIADSIDRSEKRLERFEEQVDILFMEDVQTEGKKRGYTKAAAEYETLCRSLKEEYQKTIQLLSDENMTKGEKFNSLVRKLQHLEEEREKLEQEFRRNVNRAAVRHGVSNSTIMTAFSHRSPDDDLYSGSLLDLLCSGKEKKLRKAEAAGYKEAKEFFQQEINKMQADLDAKVNKLQGDLAGKAHMIKMALKSITEEETKIVELRIMLGA